MKRTRKPTLWDNTLTVFAGAIGAVIGAKVARRFTERRRRKQQLNQ